MSRRQSIWPRVGGDRELIYNPFRKLRKRNKRPDAEPDDALNDGDFLPDSPSPRRLHREDTPYIVGELFHPAEAQLETSRNDDFPVDRQPTGPIDEEKLSVTSSNAGNRPIFPWYQLFVRPLFIFRLSKAFAQSPDASAIDTARDSKPQSRKRRLVVVEFGNTDDVTEVSPETVRHSWTDPIYSELAVTGYPVDEKGHQSSRESYLLSQPLKESLRKFMPQKGTANMRIFYVQDDRQAFLSLGQAFHMTFFGHRTNYRAWAIGPSNTPENEEIKWQWLDHLAEHLSPVQTMFWRPERSGDITRSAFGMDYPVIHLAEEFADFMDEGREDKGQSKRLGLREVPESSQQRVSVYIQLKRSAITTGSTYPSTPSLGLNENTMIMLDSMRGKTTRDELLDGVLSLKRLMHDNDAETPLKGNPVLFAAIKLVLDAVAGKWSDYILAMHNYVVSVEEIIYSQPANDRYSPFLWSLSKKLLEAERLIRLHLHLVENMQDELSDITGPNTVEPEWLRQNIKEFTRLSVEIDQSLSKPVASMIDLMYKSIGIRDARQSLELNTSLWRLSWITFIFLPLTLLAGLFGMNVDELRSQPSVKW
ncbi:hypothetical protein ACLMJK_003531 [Lecanora helva]